MTMNKRLFVKMTRFWRSDHGLSIFLGILVIAVFIIPIMGFEEQITALLADYLISVSLVAGVWAVSESRRLLWATLTVTIIAIVVRWIPLLTQGKLQNALRAGSALVTLGMFSVMIIAQVVRRGPVTVHRILGAIAAYLLFGLTWACAYQLVNIFHPGAFTGVVPGDQPFLHWVYYSLVTLTTTGYGDVTPAHQVARSLATMEAMVGQLYPAILIARLVSLEVQTQARGMKK